MTAMRWWLFKAISWIAWKVCPEPHRSRIKWIWDAKMEVFSDVAVAMDQIEKAGS